jgi:hypothetical protein
MRRPRTTLGCIPHAMEFVARITGAAFLSDEEVTVRSERSLT